MIAAACESVDEDATDFGTEAHLAALDASVASICGDRPLLLGAHSMGSTLALRWATRHPGRVRRIVCIGAPVWSSRREAVDALGATGPMARALLHDERVAKKLCKLSCAHRTLAGWAAATVAPRWPVPIARQASLHTWKAYEQTVHQQVLHEDWQILFEQLDRASVPVTLCWGSSDSIGDVDYAEQVASNLAGVEVRRIPGADHTLPAARPELVPALLERAGDGVLAESRPALRRLS